MKEKQQSNTIEPQEGLPEFSYWKRRAALFLAGQTVSLFGSSLVQFAIIWYITLSTQSGSMMTIATVCGFAPQVVISLFSGVWADRFNRRMLIIGADAMTAVATLVLALFFLAGYRDYWIIFIVVGIRSLGQGIQTPAVNALLPQIVPAEKLIRVGGINGSLQSLMFLLSPAASGAILSVASLENTFFIDVGTAAAAILIMSLLKVPLHKKALEKQKGGYFDDLKAGVRYAFKNGFLRSYFIFFAIFMFFAVPAAQLTPLMVARVFGGDAALASFADVQLLSFTEIAFSVGSVVGGIIITAWGGFKNRTRTIGMGGVLFGIFTALLGVVGGFTAFLIVVAITGFSMPLFSTPAMVLLQEQVPADMHGRVFSLVQIVMTGMLPLGMIFFGPLADKVPVQSLFVISGILFAIVAVSSFFNRHFKRGLVAE
ncbi:MFS transporter [Christensenellaceae bacterium OttesenSCG-928-K19]|nr:MFS transporter [Christensenellaceae bacterium OttesenSCG-928-K19]